MLDPHDQGSRGQEDGAPAAGRPPSEMLPLMAKKNGIDYSKIDLLSVAPNLQEQLLLKGRSKRSRSYGDQLYQPQSRIGHDPDKASAGFY